MLIENMKQIILFFTYFALLISICSFFLSASDEEIYRLDKISVTPGRFSISENISSPYFIPKSEMEKLPLIDNDIYRSAHNLPGVVADDFSARFSLRGGDRDEVLVRLDGMELYDPYHLQDFGGAISVLDMGIVKNADLLTGGFPAEYGDAMSGVFDITSENIIRDKISGNIGIDLLNTHCIFNAPISGASWLLSARRGYIDLIMELMDSEEILKPRFFDFYNKLEYDVDPGNKLSLHFLYANDSNEIDRLGKEGDLNSKYWNGMVWGKWRYIRNEKALWEFYAFSGKAGRQKYEGIDGIDERWLFHGGIKGDFTYSLANSHILKVGWKWWQSAADYNYFLQEDESAVSVDTSLRGWDMNAYIQHEWQISKKLASNLGLRSIYQNDGGDFSIMPRLALAARLRNDLILRGAYGMYNQPVQITNLPVEQGISKSQPSEKSTHYIIAAEYSPSVNILFRTEAYYKTFDDLLGMMKDYGRKEQFFFPAKSGDAKGLEIYAKHALSSRFTWGVAYALSRSELETDSGKAPRDFDRRHAINLNANYAIWNNGWINVMWRYHSGDPYTQIWYEKIYSTDGRSYSWEKKYGSINGERLPAYHSLDIRLTKNFQFKKWELEAYIQILNLYNRKNVHEYSYQKLTDNKGEIYYERLAEGLLPILPALGLSAQF